MHLVVGTSGHIDHGKTTLVKALTGIDADRLAEEKARGITIDIGFAHYRDEAGNEIAFVDVPGHERFVHNMLAGAAGLDAVLLVIAADGGVMPQTLEHLHICDLLGIKQGIVVLSRVDLVDAELLELAREDVKAAIAGTFLEQAPVIPVSSVTGQGLPNLKAELARLSQTAQGRNADLPFRFPVDRSFTLKGFGTVVTGTVLAGRLGKDEEAVQFPSGRRIRIRGLQTHGRAVETVEAGQRAAINLTGIEKEDIQRGDQLAAPESLLTSYLLNVELKLLEETPKDLTQRSRVRMHLGTREVLGRIVLLEGERFEPGQTQLIQVRLEQPVSSRHGDRFIVRNYSPLFTLGGGRVIDPAPSKSRRVKAELGTRLKALAGDEPEPLVEQAIWLQAARGVRANEGSIRTGLSARAFARAVEKLSSQGQAVNIDPGDNPRFVHAHALERVASFLERVLESYHKAFPEREGMSRAELAGKLSLLFSEKEVGAILQRLVKQGRAFLNGQAYARAGHTKSLTGQQEDALTRLIAAINAGGMMAPRKSALFEAARLDEKAGQQALNLGTHNRRLVRVKEDLYYTPETLGGIEQKLRAHLKENAQITVIDFKDLVGVTRKHAVDLLEHFDAERVTLRLDNHRVLRQG